MTSTRQRTPTSYLDGLEDMLTRLERDIQLTGGVSDPFPSSTAAAPPDRMLFSPPLNKSGSHGGVRKRRRLDVTESGDSDDDTSDEEGDYVGLAMTGAAPGPGCGHVVCGLSAGCLLRGLAEIEDCYQGVADKETREFRCRPLWLIRVSAGGGS